MITLIGFLTLCVGVYMDVTFRLGFFPLITMCCGLLVFICSFFRKKVLNIIITSLAFLAYTLSHGYIFIDEFIWDLNLSNSLHLFVTVMFLLPALLLLAALILAIVKKDKKSKKEKKSKKAPVQNWAPNGAPVPAQNWAPNGAPAQNWAPNAAPAPAQNWAPNAAPAPVQNWAPNSAPAPAQNWAPNNAVSDETTVLSECQINTGFTCSNCGAYVANDAKQCGKCGAYFV